MARGSKRANNPIPFKDPAALFMVQFVECSFQPIVT